MSNAYVAAIIAYAAHEGQYREGGEEFINHPKRVADSVAEHGEDYIITAWLHDTVEDSDITLEDLSAWGFSEAVVTAVDAMTRREGENYADYILRCKANSISRVVKYYDIRDNYTTLNAFSAERAEFQTKRYNKALNNLEEVA